MKLVQLCPAGWGSNSYLLVEKGHAFLIDPSTSVEAAMRVLAEENAVLDAILLTHGHFDHILSLDLLREKAHAPAYIHPLDAELPGDAHKSAFYTFFGKERAYRPIERSYEDGDVLSLGGTPITVRHTPGHTRGSVCLLAGSMLFTGDTLFADSYGRTDLYGGDAKALFASLCSLRELEPSLTIHPGHGKSAPLARALEAIYLF